MMISILSYVKLLFYDLIDKISNSCVNTGEYFTNNVEGEGVRISLIL